MQVERTIRKQRMAGTYSSGPYEAVSDNEKSCGCSGVISRGDEGPVAAQGPIADHLQSQHLKQLGDLRRGGGEGSSEKRDWKSE